MFFLDSNVFFFDGDEAILGVMSLDFLNGQPSSLYFYGQTYGFSFLEVLFISAGIKIFGTTMLAIKVPMLFLWLSSVSLIGLSIHKVSKNKTITFLSILIILLSPTWLVWSMKARGGYLTSFFCSSLIIYLLIHCKHKLHLITAFLIGFLLVIIWESQPLWFLPTAVMVLYGLISLNVTKKIDKIKPVIFILLGSGVVYTALRYYKSTLKDIWSTPEINFSERINEIGELDDVLINNLGGNYFLSNTYEPTNEMYSKIFLLGFIISLIIILYSFLKQRKMGVGLAFLIASFSSFTGFFVKSEPRYLLPFFTFALCAMALCFFDTKIKLNRYKTILFSVIILVGLNYLVNFKNYSFNNMRISKVDRTISNDTEVMEDLIQLLEKENIKYVYSTNEFLQYQMNYMTNNKILTIGRTDRCRTPWNVLKAQKEYENHHDEFAVIGYNFNYAYSGKIPTIDNKIFYIIRPNKKTLNDVGFFKKIQ